NDLHGLTLLFHLFYCLCMKGSGFKKVIEIKKKIVSIHYAVRTAFILVGFLLLQTPSMSP
ncbi:MAG: hypothetical protein ACOCPS_05915, partial [Desulfonatronovibrio sp.]